MNLRFWSRPTCMAALALSMCGAACAHADTVADARLWLERGYMRRALQLCEQTLVATPGEPHATAILARVRAEQGRLDDAQKLVNTAVAAAPRDADVLYALAEVSGQQAQAAGMLKAAGYAGKLKKAAEAAIAADPNHVDALEILCDFHAMAPGIMGGDKKKLPDYLARIEHVDPVAGALKRATQASRDKDTVAVARYLAQAAEHQPADARGLVQYATYLAPSWRDPARAEQLALQAVALEPWRTGGWQVLASLYAFQKRFTELDAVLLKSEAAEPSHLAPWYQAARQLIVGKVEPERAERYLRHFLSREPEIGALSPGAAYWRLGQALELQGKKADALAQVEQAVKLDPKLEDAKKDLKRMRG